MPMRSPSAALLVVLMLIAGASVPSATAQTPNCPDTHTPCGNVCCPK